MKNSEAVDNYISFASANNAATAQALLFAIKHQKDDKLKIIFAIRIYFEILQSTEMLIKLIYILKHKCDFIEGLFKDIDFPKLEKEYYEEIIKYSGKEYGYLVECLDIPEELINNEPSNVIEGIYKAIKAGLETRNTNFKGIKRPLVKFYNNIKHGFPVFLENNNVLTIYLSKNETATISTNESLVSKWVDTAIALRKTAMNLLYLLSICYKKLE